MSYKGKSARRSPAASSEEFSVFAEASSTMLLPTMALLLSPSGPSARSAHARMQAQTSAPIPGWDSEMTNSLPPASADSPNPVVLDPADGPLSWATEWDGQRRFGQEARKRHLDAQSTNKPSRARPLPEAEQTRAVNAPTRTVRRVVSPTSDPNPGVGRPLSWATEWDGQRRFGPEARPRFAGSQSTNEPSRTPPGESWLLGAPAVAAPAPRMERAPRESLVQLRAPPEAAWGAPAAAAAPAAAPSVADVAAAEMAWAEAQKASAIASARAEAIQREATQPVAPPPAASLAWDSKRPVPREVSSKVSSEVLDPVRTQTRKLLEARVARARAVLDAAIETRAREHAQAAIEEYFANRIDEVELKRRKEAAYEQASAEQKGALKLETTLETTYSTYAAAAAARVAAEQSLAMALNAEAEAAKKVDEALQAIEEN